MKKKLSELKSDQRGEIAALNGGEQFQLRLKSRGVRKGETVTIITRQPGGPLVIQAGRTQLTVGRGMAEKILVEVEE